MNNSLVIILSGVVLLLLAIIVVLQIALLRKRKVPVLPISVNEAAAVDAPQYSDDDCGEAFNAIIEARVAFQTAAAELEDESKPMIERFELISASCASNSAMLKFHLLPSVHPYIYGAAGEFIEFYDDFSATATEWILFLKREDGNQEDSGLGNYMIHLAVNSLSGDPLRRNRELKERDQFMSDALAHLEQRTGILWTRFGALLDIFEKRTERIVAEFGWTLEEAGGADK